MKEKYWLFLYMKEHKNNVIKLPEDSLHILAAIFTVQRKWKLKVKVSVYVSAETE